MLSKNAFAQTGMKIPCTTIHFETETFDSKNTVIKQLVKLLNNLLFISILFVFLQSKSVKHQLTRLDGKCVISVTRVALPYNQYLLARNWNNISTLVLHFVWPFQFNEK